MRTSPVALLALSVEVGCSTQYADPISRDPEKPLCQSYVAEFDGTSYATAMRPIQDDFTIEAWVRAASSPVGKSFADGSALIFADVETVQVDDFATATLNGKFLISVGAPDTAATSTSDVTTDQWVHVAVTRKRSTGLLLVFVNGSLEGSAIGNDHSLSRSPTITLGGRAGRNFYEGLLAEVRLWRTVRTQSQIVANMHRRLAGTEDGLASYYRLDDNAPESHAHDSSTSGNDAVFTGSATWIRSDVPLCEP